MAEWNFKEMVEDYGNEYLMETDTDSSLMEMDYFDDFYANSSPLEIAWAVRNGYSWSPNDNIRRGFNPNEDYLAFNAYANPMSIDSSIVNDYLESRIDEDYFKEWCVEQGYYEEDEE